MRDKVSTRSHREGKLSNGFDFVNIEDIWRNINEQSYISSLTKTECIFKILYNLLPSGYILSKWEQNVTVNCDLCNILETMKHMLYECP